MTNTFNAKAASALIAVVMTTTSFAEVTRAETVEFKYSPTELASVESTEELEKRIEGFARRACNTGNQLFPMEQRRECREDLVEQLHAQIFTAG